MLFRSLGLSTQVTAGWSYISDGPYKTYEWNSTKPVSYTHLDVYKRQDLYNTSVTKGNQESHGQNFQKLGKDLMSVDELAVMDGGKCLLQIRGVRPFLSRKYDIPGTLHLLSWLW